MRGYWTSDGDDREMMNECGQEAEQRSAIGCGEAG